MAKAYVYTCSCGKRLRLRREDLGKPGKCRQCKTSFVAQRSDVTPESQSAPQARKPAQKPAQRAAGSPRPEADTGWQPGTVILDSCIVECLLGEGGMGKVYRVYHRGWDAQLALKVPKAHIVASVTAALDFERECQTWINLGLHPNTVSCYFVRRLDETPLVFAEYVSGGSLSSWISGGRLYRGGPERALPRVLDIATQFAWGLHYAHEQGLVHQDIKPANVMMTRDRMVKVTDFGLAKARAVLGERPRTSRKELLVSAGGMTPAYCSPEQALHEPLSLKTDIWSWGLSILEMFTGSVTWMAGQAAPAVLEDYVQSSTKGHKNKGLPQMPPSLAELLRECFQADPDSRPDDMNTIAARLQDIYLEATGNFYTRDQPASTRVVGDPLHVASLNNGAVSMVELGRSEDAYKLFTEAEMTAKAFEEVGPAKGLQEIAYNRCLVQIRTNPVFDVRSVPSLVPSPPDPLKHVYLTGMLLLEGGELYDAIDYLGRAVEMGESYRADTLTAHGASLLLAGETRPAILSFKKALRLAPERMDILRNLALAYYYDGNVRKALQYFQKMSSGYVMDSEDSIRSAALLSAAGLTREARAYIQTAMAAPGRSAEVTLTAAELAAGAQTFLPGVVPVKGAESNPRALTIEVLEKDPRNLRAGIDRETLPRRFGFRPSARIRWRARLMPETDSLAAIGGHASLTYQPLTNGARWGDLPRGTERTKCLILAALVPMILASQLWAPLVEKGRLEQAFGTGSPNLQMGLWGIVGLVLLFVVTRTQPRRGIWREVLFACLGLPFAFYLPTAAHHVYMNQYAEQAVPYFSKNHLDYLFSISIVLVVVLAVREFVYQRLVCRVRAFGSLSAGILGKGKRGRNDGPDAEGGYRVTQRTEMGQLVSKAATALSFSPLEVLWARVWSFPRRSTPRLVAAFRRTRAAFGQWQAFLLPEILVMAITDTMWLASSSPSPIVVVYFALMLGAHLLLLAYAALVPRFFIIANFVLAILAAAGFCLAVFGEPSPLAILAAIGLYILFAFLNWLALETCPAFAPLEKNFRLDAWDVQTLLDPLNIRRFAAPWQLIRIGTESQGTEAES